MFTAVIKRGRARPRQAHNSLAPFGGLIRRKPYLVPQECSATSCNLPWKGGLYVHETITNEGLDFTIGQANLLHRVRGIPQNAIAAWTQFEQRATGSYRSSYVDGAGSGDMSERFIYQPVVDYSITRSRAMTSLQRSMHSSQIYTPGPTINLLTSFSAWPQNEQRRLPVER